MWPATTMRSGFADAVREDVCGLAVSSVQDEYELVAKTKLVSSHAARHWRRRHHSQGSGAFDQLHVGCLLDVLPSIMCTLCHMSAVTLVLHRHTVS